MRTFQMHLLEADKVFFEGECESLVVPTTVGSTAFWRVTAI